MSIGKTDKRHLSATPIIRVPWFRVDREVPEHKGHYLVSVDHSEGMKSIRLEYWDGKGWPLSGGYATVEAWYYLPQPLGE